MRRTTQYWLVFILGVVAAVAVALPLVAQENGNQQPIVNRAEALKLDLGTFQRRGPGGDLEHAAQAAGMDATINCTSFCSECHWLDSYNAVNTYDPAVPGSQVINVLSTTNTLASGKTYLITITGTVSYWSANYYTAPIGNPGTQPMFLSPAVPSGQQGDVASDWEYLYAYPNGDMGNIFASGPIQLANFGISLDNGVTFQNLTPVTGLSYSLSHAYSYLVLGTGKKAQFRTQDQGPHNDNYGRFWICVQAVTPCGNVTPPTNQ